MPAKSKSQRRCAGWTYYLKYKRHLKRYPPKAPDCIKKMWNMNRQDLKKLAKTPEKNLPEKITDNIKHIIIKLLMEYL